MSEEISIKNINVEGLLNLFSNCDITVDAENQTIFYAYPNLSYVIYFGTYALKSEAFYWSWYFLSPFFVPKNIDDGIVLNKILQPIFEKGIKRKVSESSSLFPVSFKNKII